MTVQGKRVEGEGVVANERATFTVDPRHAGTAELGVTMVNDCSETLDVSVTECEPRGVGGVYECEYTSLSAGRHHVIVTYGHVNVKHSPFKFCCWLN